MSDFIKLMSLSLLVTLQLVGCAQQEENMRPEVQLAQPLTIETVAATKPKLDALLERMSQFIKLDCEHDKQCKTIGVGVSPCGGSPKHLIYSTKSSDVAKLTKMVQSYNKSQKREQKGMVGTCRFILPPKTFCSKQTHTCLTTHESLL